jgi:hypothetical protein
LKYFFKIFKKGGLLHDIVLNMKNKMHKKTSNVLFSYSTVSKLNLE